MAKTHSWKPPFQPMQKSKVLGGERETRSKAVDISVMDTEDTMEESTKVEKQENSKPKKLKKMNFSSLVKQVETEYQLAWTHLKPKIDEWAVRLKVYSNQKRDKTAVGDPLLFTIMQTVVASMYNDRLVATHEAREEGDADTAETLNALASFDYDLMDKAIFDYDWDWNTAFFGRGLLLNMEYDPDRKCPMPEVIDNMTWLRDPRARSVNGDAKRRGAMRFGGREITLTHDQMEKAGVYFDFDDLKSDSGDIRSLTDNNIAARNAAQGLSEARLQEQLTGDNAEHRLLEWFTHWNGKRVFVTLAANRKTVVRYREIKQDFWPIVDRPMYPISHDWDGVSIPDLIEDKQRARSVVQNTALAGVKSGQQPTYLYDSNKIKNRGNLEIDFNKHIPIDGSPAGAIELVQRQQVKSEVDWILNTLDLAAQKATATPDIQQGAASGSSRTATETNLVSEKVDTRYSLTAKIWGWSEREFWRQWYMLYKEFFNSEIDEKVIRISGAMGAKWRKLTRENIIAKVDPDVFIESKTVSDQIKNNDLQKYRLFLKDIMSTDPQSSNVRFALRKIGHLSGFKKDEVEQVLPPTVDEMNAEDENEQLTNNKKVLVKVYDDDFIHMEMHNKAADTPAKYAHIQAHKTAMMLKRAKPEMDMARNRPDAPVPEANMGAPLANAAPQPVAMGRPQAPTLPA